MFDALAEAEPGTFYLTDFLARQFDTLVIEGLGLDRHPELLPDYFGNYRRLVYLAQTEDPELQAAARSAADRLGLAYEYRYTGLGELAEFVRSRLRAASMAEKVVVYWRDIPAQVIVKAGRKTAKRQLPERFEQAIDRAAMRAELTGTDAYLEQWRRADPMPCGDDLEAEASAAAEALEAEFTAERLRELVANGGNATA